jgi:predicted aspartyl protease
MRIQGIFGSLAILVAGLGSPAWAEDCKPLLQINSVDLVAAAPNRALIPVSINGIPKLFLLDTGGDISQINGEVAEELDLPRRDSAVKMLDLYGHASSKYVTIEKFTVGRLSGDIDLAVEPDPNFGRGTRYVGIYAPDLMGRYDVEIDFGTYKMNYFSPDHCPGKVVYWPHNALSMLPFTFHKRHIRFTVKVDGKELLAEIDTGAPRTTMTAEAAKRLFDLVPDSPGNVPLNAQGMAAAFGRVFDTLDFEGVAVKNPRVIVIPELVGSKDPNNGFRTDTRARQVDDLDDRSDMLIGMDIVRKLHFYIAFGGGRIFISEASPPPKKPDEPAASPATASTTQQ